VVTSLKRWKRPCPQSRHIRISKTYRPCNTFLGPIYSTKLEEHWFQQHRRKQWLFRYWNRLLLGWRYCVWGAGFPVDWNVVFPVPVPCGPKYDYQRQTTVNLLWRWKQLGLLPSLKCGVITQPFKDWISSQFYIKIQFVPHRKHITSRLQSPTG
jgi:hypothetical protein